jgi:hypothetical protein
MAVNGDVAVEAQFLLLKELSDLGLANVAIGWADELIRGASVPDIGIIDLALVSSRNRSGLISALENLGRPTLTSRELVDMLLSRLRSEALSANISPRQAADMLSYFRSRCSVLTPDEDAEFSIASDKLEIAEFYTGNLDEVTLEFFAFLSRYG